MNKEFQNIELSGFQANYEANERDGNAAELLAEQEELIRDLVTARNVIAFGTIVGMRLNEEKGGFEFHAESVYPQKDFIKTLQMITNNMDENFTEFVVKEGEALGAKGTSKTFIIENMADDLLARSEYFKQSYETMLQERQGSPIMLSDVQECVDKLKALSEEREICWYNDDVMYSAADAEFAVNYYDYWERMHPLTKVDEVKEQSKLNEGLEVVESNDGYVMNHNLTAEMAAERPDLAQQYNERTTDGVAADEIVHNETPRETTSDPSRVSPNIKLEETEEQGTQEKEQGQESAKDKEKRESKNNEKDLAEAAVVGIATKAVTLSTPAATAASAATLAAKKAKRDDMER